jgi:site-specific recombinase XerD
MATKKRQSRQAERIERIKFLSREQVKAFFSVVKDRRDKALFLLLYKRGLRASEPGLLLVEDYDRKTGRLYTRRLKGSVSGLHLLQRDEIRALNLWLRERETRGIDSDFLFPGRTGRGLSRKQVFENFQRYAERAGLPEDKRHPHTLKHSVATHLLEIGADVRDVQDLLGHAEIDSTLVYAAITNKRRDKTARDIAAKLPSF